MTTPPEDAGDGPDAAATDTSERAAPQTATIGAYVLGDRIAAGGGGVVYKARDPDHDQTVAIKLLLPGDARGTATARSRLLREGQALAKLTHENIVRVFDIGTYDPATLQVEDGAQTPSSDAAGVFIVMEYIRGQDLARWLRDKRPSWRWVLDTFVAAGQGLAAAHAAGLVHGDFKPANVLIGDDGRVCVADFGLARATRPTLTGPLTPVGQLVNEGAKGLGAAPPDLSLTATGALLGTPAHMPPEQQTGSPTHERGDQFSFCVALWEAWFGRSPFDGATAAKVLEAKLAGAFAAPPKQHNIPAELLTIVRQGMAPDPVDRFASMDVLLDQLLAPRSKPMRRAVAGMGVAAAIAAAAAFYVTTGSDAACRQLRTDMAAVWSQQVRSRVATRPLGARVNARVDRWVEAWSSTVSEQCWAENIDAATAQLRLTCLEGQRRLFGHVMLLEPEAEAAAWAHAEAHLPDPGECTAGRIAASDPSAPVRATATQLEALRLVRRNAEAGALMDALADRLDAREGSSRARDDARVVLARLHVDEGRPDAAAAQLSALETAAAPELAAQANLVRVQIAVTGKLDQALLQSSSTAALHDAEVPMLAARRHLGLARYLLRSAQPTQALRQLTDAEASLSRLGRPHPLEAMLLEVRSQAEEALGQHPQAAETRAAHRARLAELYGDGHPFANPQHAD